MDGSQLRQMFSLFPRARCAAAGAGANVRPGDRPKRLAVSLTLVWLVTLPAAAPAADRCKECQEFLKACLQAHSKAACQTDHKICIKHCKDK